MLPLGAGFFLLFSFQEKVEDHSSAHAFAFSAGAIPQQAAEIAFVFRGENVFDFFENERSQRRERRFGVRCKNGVAGSQLRSS